MIETYPNGQNTITCKIIKRTHANHLKMFNIMLPFTFLVAVLVQGAGSIPLDTLSGTVKGYRWVAKIDVFYCHSKDYDDLRATQFEYPCLLSRCCWCWNRIGKIIADLCVWQIPHRYNHCGTARCSTSTEKCAPHGYSNHNDFKFGKLWAES